MEKINEINDEVNITETYSITKVSESNEIKEGNEITEINEDYKIEETNSINEEFEETQKSKDSYEVSDSTQNIVINKYCKDNKQIINEEGECICDNSRDYYPIKYNSIIYNDQCYNIQTKPDNFFLDKDKKIFEQCNKNCKSCYYHGDENENNCTSCINII